VVCDDADLDSAVPEALRAPIRIPGKLHQREPYFRAARVFRGITARFATAARKLRVTPTGSRSRTRHGSMINAAGLETVEQHVADAVQRGASVLAGGQNRQVRRLRTAIYQPTVLTV